MMNKKEAIKKILASTSWFHSFEIIPGVITPGRDPYNPSHILDEWLELKQDLSGLSVLEIGSWDGALSFELERRGAKVVAMDIQNPENSGFNIAKDILNSKVNFVQGSVYDLSSIFKQKFDIVFMLGVLYHLKHPLLALEELKKVVKEKSRIYLEGEMLIHYCENLNGRQLSDCDLHIKYFEDKNIPVTLCYPGKFKKGTNWFIPSISTLQSWTVSSGFEMKNFKIIKDNYPDQRYTACLIPSINDVEEEHPVYLKDNLPGNISILKGRAKLFCEIGDFENFYKTCRIAISILEGKDKNSIDYYNLASFYKDINENSLAEKNFMNVINDSQLSDNDLKAGASFHLGEIYEKNQNETKAAKWFENCIKLNPNFELAKLKLKHKK